MNCFCLMVFARQLSIVFFNHSRNTRVHHEKDATGQLAA